MNYVKRIKIMEAIAKAKYLKGSPQKARLVIDLVRGKNVSQALAILKFTNKRAADPIAKCLNSAIANATYKAEQDNIAIDPDDLWIKTCYVDMGPTKNRRRLRPAPQGRAYFERRHYCHITIEVTSEPQEEEEKTFEKRGKKAMAKKSGEDKKADKKSDDVKETKADETEKVEKATETKVAETESTEEKAVAETKTTAPEETKAEAKAEAKEDKVSEAGKEDKSSSAKPETNEDPVGEVVPENKPLAAQTDEEKTGTDKAADRQVDDNEELEKQ